MLIEVAKFEADLLESVRQMRRGQAARVTQVKLTPTAKARQKVGMSQLEFALFLGVSARTLQEWEQGRREPMGAAKTLLRVAQKHPTILSRLAGGCLYSSSRS
jgi:putative transcriptional regulator